MATKQVSTGKANFLGSTPGNSALPINRTSGGGGGKPSVRSAGGKFLGDTKGNRVLPIDRSTGYDTGHGGGPNKAGGHNC